MNRTKRVRRQNGKPKRFNKNGIPIVGDRPSRQRNFPGER